MKFLYLGLGKKKTLLILVMKFTCSKAFWTSLYYTIWFEHSFIVLILCFKYMVFVAVAISNVVEIVCFSCLRVNDNGNGLEFVEFVVLVNFFILLGSCQGGGIEFCCVDYMFWGISNNFILNVMILTWFYFIILIVCCKYMVFIAVAI